MCLIPALALAWLAAPASAEVMNYSRCKLEAGKTVADVQAWVNAWRKLKASQKIDYEVRILQPHADNDLGVGEFFLEGRSSTLVSHAAAWTWWYSDEDALKSAAQLNAAASCDSGAIYRSTD